MAENVGVILEVAGGPDPARASIMARPGARGAGKSRARRHGIAPVNIGTGSPPRR